jgi:AhpD family alkylhydroperoxidase
MKSRLSPHTAAPEELQALRTLSMQIKNGLEPGLVHLVLTRVSQINGCAYCLHMHTLEARAEGETEDRLYLLNAWRESLIFTPRERAALGWAESLTKVSETHAPDADYEEAAKHFSEQELVKLTLLIGAINIWNRIAIGFRIVHPAESEKARAAAE